MLSPQVCKVVQLIFYTLNNKKYDDGIEFHHSCVWLTNPELVEKLEDSAVYFIENFFNSGSIFSINEQYIKMSILIVKIKLLQATFIMLTNSKVIKSPAEAKKYLRLSKNI
jgi:hypothetical protein